MCPTAQMSNVMGRAHLHWRPPMHVVEIPHLYDGGPVYPSVYSIQVYSILSKNVYILYKDATQ